MAKTTTPSSHYDEQILSELRARYGRSTSFWAGEAAVSVEPGRWLALTGARSTFLNAALCHGRDGAKLIETTLEDVTAAKTPLAISIAGEALGSVAPLLAAGWICVGAAPFMVASLRRGVVDDAARATAGALDADVRRLTVSDLPSARLLIGTVFGLPDHLAAAALPDSITQFDRYGGWGLYDGDTLVSFVGTSVVEQAVSVWSMATAAEGRRSGHGRRLLVQVLAHLQVAGADSALLCSTPQGENFYGSLGFEVLEWWQLWSRRRWVLV
jgi:ribosomal protein S18 acetylase RimI-like enzyme